MNLQRFVSSVYFENIADKKLVGQLNDDLKIINPTLDYNVLRTLYTIQNGSYTNAINPIIQYIIDKLFFDVLFGKTISRLYKNNSNTIILFPVYKDIDSANRLSVPLKDIYSPMLTAIDKKKEFDRDVNSVTKSGNMYLFVPAFSDNDETIEEYETNLKNYFDRALEFINEQKQLKIGEVIKPSLYGKFENLIYTVDKNNQFFTGYYKKKLSSEKTKVLNEVLEKFTEKFGRISSPKDPFLSLTKEESLRKYKADGYKDLSYLTKFNNLLETFIDVYKKTNDVEYLKTSSSTDNQSIFRIFYRINNTDFVDEYDVIKTGSNYVYKITEDLPNGSTDCKVGYFRDKKGLTNQYIFREYTGLSSNYCNKKVEDEDIKQLEESEYDDRKETIVPTEYVIETKKRGNTIVYRRVTRDSSELFNGKVEKLFDLHIYEKYKWFQFNELGNELKPETKIKFYKNILFDKDSFVEFLKKNNRYKEKMSLGIEFLKINQDNSLLLEYVDFILLFKRKSHVFKETFFSGKKESFVERTKKAILAILFETNETIYLTQQKSKVSKDNKNNYKIISYQYYNATKEHFNKEIYDDKEIKYCKKGECEINNELSNKKIDYAIAIVDVTRENIEVVSELKKKTYCKKTRRKLRKLMQPFLRAVLPQFGGKTKKVRFKRLRSRRRKDSH